MLAIAVIFFVTAAAFGLAANSVLRYSRPSTAALMRGVQTNWNEPLSNVARGIAETHVLVLQDVRRKNQIKALILIAAMISEIVAIVMVGVAIRAILS